MPGRVPVLHAERAVVADRVDRVGDHAADLLVVGRDRRDARELVARRDLARLLVAEMRDACATASSMPRRIAIGSAPASTLRMPSRTIACASTVAVVVPSPAIVFVADATWRTSCAPWFANVSPSAISPAMVTPSLVIVGAARRVREQDVAAARAERRPHRVGDGVDPGHQRPRAPPRRRSACRGGRRTTWCAVSFTSPRLAQQVVLVRQRVTTHSVTSTILAIDAACCERRARDERRVDHARLERSQYAPVAASRPSPASSPRTVADDDRRVEAGVAGDLAQRLLERAADDVRAGRLVGREAGGVDRGLRVQQRDAAAREDPLVQRGARRLHRVVRPGACAPAARVSVAAPTRITATCPPSRAIRSRSLSRSYSLRWPFAVELGADLPIRCSTALAGRRGRRRSWSRRGRRRRARPGRAATAGCCRSVSPSSCVTGSPPVRIARSSCMARALRRRTPASARRPTSRAPRSLLTHERRRARRPTTFSARSSSGLPVGMTCSSSGSSSSAVLSRSPEIRMYASSSTASRAVGVGDHVRRDVARRGSACPRSAPARARRGRSPGR